MKFDRFDAKILDALQRDGRLSVVDLAESIGLSATPCARRIKALETSGAIEGYTAVLNPARVGLAVLAIVESACACHAHAGEDTGTAEDLARLCAAVDRLGLAVWVRVEDSSSSAGGGS